MKKFFCIMTLVTAFCGTSGYAAVTPDSSWDEINTTAGVRVKYPKVEIDGTFYPVIELCVDGPNLRTFDTQSTCVEKKGFTCSDREYFYHSTPIVSESSYCDLSNGTCRRETYLKVIPTSYQIEVYSQMGVRLFSKYLDLPECDGGKGFEK